MDEINDKRQKGVTNWQTQATMVLLTLVELGWVLPWYGTLARTRELSYISAVLLLGGVMLVSYVTTMFAVNLNLIKSIHLILQGLVLILSITILGPLLLDVSVSGFIRSLIDVDPSAIFTFLVVAWMWWRGSTLIQERAHPQGVWQRFRMGLALLVSHIVLTSWIGLEEPRLGWFLLFLFVGFLALVFARVAYISNRSSGTSPFNARWLAGIALLLGLFLALAALLGSLLTGQFSMVLDLLNLGIRWITTAVLLLAALPGMIIGGILGGFIAWLRDQLGTGETQVVEPEQESLAYLLPEEIPDPQPLSPEIQSLIFWAIIAVILVWVFWRLGRRIRHAPLPEISQPESLLEPGEAGILLRKVLQNSLDDLLARLSPQRRILPAESIRRIYIQLLDLFDTLDLARPTTQTPLEYLPVIQAQMPAVAEDLEIITDAYIQVRYGEIDEADLGVERVETAWQRVMEAGKQTE